MDDLEKVSYQVTLTVTVEAFDKDDAKSLLDDYFAPGMLGDFIDIKTRTYKEKS
jgi:hypothetical protein